MSIRVESRMIAPIRGAIASRHCLDVWLQEYRSGYGIADLVGMAVSGASCTERARGGQDPPLEDPRLMEVLLRIPPGRGLSFEGLARRVALAPSSLQHRVLRPLIKRGLVVKKGDRYFVCGHLPNPAEEIVAVEAKINRWSDAVLQARRYTLFAHRSYIAVPLRVLPRIDRFLLYRHRIGLIGVEAACAQVVIEAPRIRPRDLCAHRTCAESLYSEALAGGACR